LSSVSTQFFAFGVTVLTGVIIGILFDFYRVLRGQKKRPRKLITNLGDLIFWLMATAIAFSCLIFGNWGEVRVYVFIGLLLGLLFYYYFCSRFLIRFLVFALKSLRTIFKSISYYVIRPLGLPFLWLRRRGNKKEA